MRQWHCNPKIMCRKHLLGEHVEHHMFIGSLKKRINLQGYIDNNLLEPLSLGNRHAELVDEMLNRGMNHKSPLDFSETMLYYLNSKQKENIVDRVSALNDLLSRCTECMLRYNTL